MTAAAMERGIRSTLKRLGIHVVKRQGSLLNEVTAAGRQ
jgi:hypothetical protein